MKSELDITMSISNNPCTIVFDHRPQFASQVMRDLCKCLGITPKLSTTHHPQTDGQTEQMNCDLQQYLHIFTAEKQNEWADWIALVQFSYNMKRQSSTKKSPFQVTHTYSPWMGIEKRSTKVPAADLLTEEISYPRFSKTEFETGTGQNEIPGG